jgi:Repeat of unknown function (DUF346)
MRFNVLTRQLAMVFFLALPLVAQAQQHVFARGEDGSLMHYDGARWQSLGGRIVGAPDACSWGPARIDVVVRDTDNKLSQIALVNGTWSQWFQHDGNLASSPACVSWGPNRIDVFAVDAATRAMQRKVWDGSAWSGWSSIGGEFPAGAAPDAVSNGVNDITVVARGMDSTVWTIHHGAGGWGPWTPTGQRANSDPGAIARGAGRVDLWVQGPDNQMMHSSAGSWTSRGGLFTSGDGPDGVATSSNEYVLYVRGSDGELWRGRGAANFAGWDMVGGRITSDPAVVSLGGSAAAAARGRFRVTLTGFRVIRPTWDDILERDGKWDEVFLVTDSATLHRNGTLSGTRALRDAVVIGDTNNFPARRRGGSASDLGGFREGNTHPAVALDALRRPPASFNNGGEPAFIVFDGELVEGEKSAVIVPTIWEWDPPTHLHDQYVASMREGLSTCANVVAPIVWGDHPIARLAAGCTPTDLRLSTIRIGEAAARPIGMKPAGDHYTYSPWVVGLNYRGAAALTAAGPGVIPVRYVDFDDLKGDYELFLVVERVE